MNSAYIKFKVALNALDAFSTSDKILFLEALLFQLTIAGRGIWSDDQPSDSEKTEALKWLNELSHRIWNIRFDLLQSESNDIIIRLYENMKFYEEQSNLLKSHLVPTILSTFENFRQRLK